MIKFGISENYVSNWGVVQAIREIYQNFIDYGDFNVDIEAITDTRSIVRLSNDFKPESWEFLKIGFSKKKDGAIGKHGEGIKLAGLVLKRNGNYFKISTNIGTASAAFYEDEDLGTCYGLDNNSKEVNDKFEVMFEVDTKDIKIFEQGRIYPEDIVSSCYYGSIVSKPKGNIYVGGLYVCNHKGLKYALDFKPQYMDLGRDREMPSTFDIEYGVNQIVNCCSNSLSFKASDINNVEFNVGSLPRELSGKFNPVVSEEGNVYLKSGKTIVSDDATIREISKNPVVAKKIEKIKYKALFKKKKAPSTFLKELKEELNLNQSQSVKFDSIIKLSKNWKVK